MLGVCLCVYDQCMCLCVCVCVCMSVLRVRVELSTNNQSFRGSNFALLNSNGLSAVTL